MSYQPATDSQNPIIFLRIAASGSRPRPAAGRSDAKKDDRVLGISGGLIRHLIDEKMNRHAASTRQSTAQAMQEFLFSARRACVKMVLPIPSIVYYKFTDTFPT